MADNVVLDAGAGGATIKTDDDGSAHWQYIKNAFGADNTQTRVTTTEGMPIQNDDTDLKVTLDSEAVVLGAGSAAIGKLAANSGVDIGDVDVTSHPVDTFVAEDGALGKGVLVQGDDATDRHNLACDTSGRLKIDIAEQSDASDLKVTLDGEAVVLGAGSDAIGKLAANSGVDIGDVDVTSQPADTFVAEGGALGKGVLLQGDDTTDRKNVHVDATTGNLQVDVAAALPAGSNAIGKLVANDGVDIGNVDVASQPARDRTTDNVGAALVTDALMNDTTALTPKFANINGNTSGNNTLVAAVGGKKIRVLAISLVAAGNVTLILEDGAGGGDLLGPLEFDGSTQPKGIVLQFCPLGHFETTANTLLNMSLDAAIQVGGHVVYVEV